MLISKSQLYIFALIYGVYAICLVIKRNSSFWILDLVSYKVATVEQIGLLGFWWEFLNGIAKIGGGIIVDSVSPSLLLSNSLLFQGLTCLLLFAVPWWPYTVFCWSINGIAQAVAWPALTRIFLSWFPNPSQRGMWYSVLATNQNTGAALGPILTSQAAETFGWKARLYIPGVLSTVGGIFVLKTSRDTPSAGFFSFSAFCRQIMDPFSNFKLKNKPLSTPPQHSDNAIDAPSVMLESMQATSTAISRHAIVNRNRDDTISLNSGSNLTGSVASTASSVCTSSSSAAAPHLSVSSTVRQVLTSRNLWLLSWCYFFNSAVRTALPLLIRPLCESTLGFAVTSGVSEGANLMFEVGGALGSFIAGMISDKQFSGRRGPLMVLFSLLCVPFMLLLRSPATLAAPLMSMGPSTPGYSIVSFFYSVPSQTLVSASFVASQEETGSSVVGGLRGRSGIRGLLVDSSLFSSSSISEQNCGPSPSSTSSYDFSLKCDEESNPEHVSAAEAARVLTVESNVLEDSPKLLVNGLFISSNNAPSDSEISSSSLIAVWPGFRVSMLFFALGFLIFPPHVLNGLASRELAPQEVMSTAGGFTKAMGQLGSAVSSLHLLGLLGSRGWYFIGCGLGVMCLLSAAFCVPLWDSEPFFEGDDSKLKEKGSGVDGPQEQEQEHPHIGGSEQLESPASLTPLVIVPTLLSESKAPKDV